VASTDCITQIITRLRRNVAGKMAFVDHVRGQMDVLD
jgi:hypothetical protein